MRKFSFNLFTRKVNVEIKNKDAANRIAYLSKKIIDEVNNEGTIEAKNSVHVYSEEREIRVYGSGDGSIVLEKGETSWEIRTK